MNTPFSHRSQAGEVLAHSLSRYAGRHDVTVLGVPSGGALVAFEVARHLSVPLDLCFLEAITSPRGDITVGSLGWPPSQQLHEPIINALGMNDEPLRQATAHAWRRLRQRIHSLRPPAPPPSLNGRTVILVDEGAAQGFLLRDAAGLVRRTGARTLVAAVPVGAREALRLLTGEFDEVVCPWQPIAFDTLASFYADFRLVTEDEVRSLLLRAWGDWGAAEADGPGTS
ncbi:phosphoribosyltransferase [Hyalangium sp.]|uniref:phosphoribosyltransferase n=1 Tax=Hyalangium sp. TaxID=2028555 RepID=UPI002D75D01E|nr:phosphoribosyltransferase family protein [Hyalangium sp.]HYH95255.1 phosphoribosyltransferase family protein [Hyalangium sp.]